MNKFPYRITKNEKYGRYLIANRLIKQGEIIIKEPPLLITPHFGGPPICFNCCNRLRKFQYCEACKIAMLCQSNCYGQFHNQSECKSLKSLNINPKILITNPEIITTLRCLLLRQQNPEVWGEFVKLESHLEERRNTEIWRQCRIEIEQILQQIGVIEQNDFDEEIVQRICGIIDVNSFEIRPKVDLFSNNPVDRLRGIYPKSSLLAHDCLSNTHVSVDDDFILTIRAAEDIPKDSTIFFNYTNSLKGSLERQEHLREGKYFQCCCNRCLDPTELNTEMNSLICPKCREGLIRLVDDKFWCCSQCQHNYSHSLIMTTIQIARDKIQQIILPDVKEIENLLKNLQQTFHKNHYLLLEIEQNLIQLYNQMLPHKKNLKRKIELCGKLLEIFDRIEPKISRFRGILLYQLHTALVSLAQKEFNNKEITDVEFLEKLLEIERILKDSIRILLYEPKRSPEGNLAQNALSELKLLKSNIDNIKMLINK